MYQYGDITWVRNAQTTERAAPCSPSGGRQLHWVQEARSSTTQYNRQEIKMQGQPKTGVKRKTNVEKELDNMRKELAKKQREEKRQLESTSKKLATVKKIEAKFKADKKKTKAVAKIKNKKEPSFEMVYEKIHIKKR